MGLPTGEQTPDTTGPSVDQSDSQGSEAQINTETDGQGNLIPIPKDKWRDTQRDAREYQKLQREIANQQLGQTQQPASYGQGDLPTDDGSLAAINAIAAAVESRMAPHLSAMEKYTQDQAIAEVGSRPYAPELAKEIASHYVSPDLRHLGAADRLDRAYKLAVGENIDRIMNLTTSQARSSGQEAAYQKIAEKQSAQTVSSGASAPREGGTYTEQFEALEGSEKDSFYNKHREQIWKEAGLGTPRR